MAELTLNDDDRLYLQMMQENITRMSSYSANAKVWLITLVTAFLSIGTSLKNLDNWMILALVPVFSLWYMDAYYLRIERKLRNRERHFLNVVLGKESDCSKYECLYNFSPLAKKVSKEDLYYVETNCQLFNNSVYPLYLVMSLIIVLATGIINEWFYGMFF